MIITGGSDFGKNIIQGHDQNVPFPVFLGCFCVMTKLAHLGLCCNRQHFNI